jgi:hypothetical protein
VSTTREFAERNVVALMVGAVAVGAVVSVLLVMFTFGAQRLEGERDDAGNLAVQQAGAVQQVCDRGGDAGRELAVSGECERAREVRVKVADAGVPITVTVPAAAVVDPQELIGYVRQAVADYCGARADCTPPPAVLVDAVAAHLTKNPPKPGRAPTAEEVEAGARAVLQGAPELFRGADGEDGADATDDQVAAQVAAYCAGRGECRGETGAQGVGVASVAFQRDDGGRCLAVVVLRDPADGRESTASAPAGDAACEPIPTTEPTGLLPTP